MEITLLLMFFRRCKEYSEYGQKWQLPPSSKTESEEMMLNDRGLDEDDYEQKIHTCRRNGSHNCSFLSVNKGAGVVPFDGFYGYVDGLAYYYSESQAIKACTVNALVHVASKRKMAGVPTWYERQLPLGQEMDMTRDHIMVLAEKLSDRPNHHRLFGVLFFRLN
jgi:hypothetical protein